MPRILVQERRKPRPRNPDNDEDSRDLAAPSQPSIATRRRKANGAAAPFALDSSLGSRAQPRNLRNSSRVTGSSACASPASAGNKVLATCLPSSTPN